MLYRQGVTRAIAAVFILSTVTAIPRNVSDFVPVQISTLDDNAVYMVMRDDLAFYSPDAQFYVARMLWRKNTYDLTTCMSLKIYNTGSDLNSSTAVNLVRYITRDGGNQPRNLTLEEAKQAIWNWSALLETMCCGCANGDGSVTYYWNQGSAVSILSPRLDEAGQRLKLTRMNTSIAPSCTMSNVNIRLFPYVKPQTGEPHPTSPMGRRRRSANSSTIVVQLLADFGDERFVVGIRNTTIGNKFELFTSPYQVNISRAATAFYYEGYTEYHVSDTTGNLIRRPAFTLQHAETGLYVAADVLDDLSLNANGAGLALKNMTKYDYLPSELPDYRFFSRYDDQALNFWSNSNRTPERELRYYDRRVHIFCALYHRRHCLQPVKSDPLRFVSVSSCDQRRHPTLADPATDFIDFLENLEGNLIIPTFKFLRI